MADIGSLVVKLVAETAEFQADLGKSARLLDKHANEMKASLQSVANVGKSAFALAVGVMSLPPESGSHNEMHNLVCGRISDEKDKGAVYAGI